MIEIRKMELRDIDSVYALGTDEKRFKVGGKEQVGFWTKGQLERWVESESDVLIVAEENKRVIGYALSQYHAPTRKATFENLHVDLAYRGQEIGAQLTEKLVYLLRKKGAKYICGLPDPENKAIVKVLEQQGFKKGKTLVWMDLQV